MWRPAPIELAAWCALAAILALGLLSHTGAVALGNDACQYLSVADNIRQGNGIKTSILFYDAERSHGTIPAPMTTFPPVYSVLTAALATTGVSTALAAAGISLVSFALSPLIIGLAVPAGMRPVEFRVAMLLLVLNSCLLATACSIAAEELFMLVVAAAVLCFSRALLTVERRGLAWQACGWLLLGLSYWIRYAGLFLLAGALAFFCLRALLHRGRRTSLDLSTSILALSAAGASMARNVALSGSWKGSVAKRSYHLWPVTARPSAAALYHVLLGEAKAGRGIAVACVFAGVAGLLLLGFRSWWLSRGRSAKFAPAYWMLWVLICTYTAAMVYADTTMVVSVGSVYFSVLLPLLLLLGAYSLSAIESASTGRALRLLCLAFVSIGYVGAHVTELWRYTPFVAPDEVTKAWRGSGSASDLTSWARTSLSPTEVITATNGQATAYALRHPTLCVTDPPFTSVVWNRDRLFLEMERFRSNYLILYPGLRDEASPVQRTSPLIRGMIDGVIPDGLQVVARNASVIVLRRTPRQ
jgi:hypothetical protein